MLSQKSKKTVLFSVALLICGANFSPLFSASTEKKKTVKKLNLSKEKKHNAVVEKKDDLQPYYSWFGKMVNGAQTAYNKFIITSPKGSAAIISAVEGGIVGFYLYKIKPGEKLSGKRSVVASIIAGLSCFVNRCPSHEQKKVLSENTERPSVDAVMRDQAASLPVEIMVRGAVLLWQLVYESWWLLLKAEKAGNIVSTDSKILNLFDPKKRTMSGLVAALKEAVIDYMVIPFALDSSLMVTERVTSVVHELGHAITNRLIMGSPFRLGIGSPYKNYYGVVIEKTPLLSKTILGVPVEFYASWFVDGICCCRIEKMPDSKVGNIAVLAAGPLAGITGALALHGMYNLMAKKPLISKPSFNIQTTVSSHIDNLLMPQHFVGADTDGARIFNKLGINP